MTTKDLVVAGLFAAVMAVLAQISLPLPFTPIPLTGQAFGVFLTGALLGNKLGTITIIIYLLIGAAGIPVFHAGQGGLQVIFGPTGGYLFGFIAGVYFLGKVIGNKKEVSYLRLVLAMFGCLLIYFTLGTLQLALITNLKLSQAIMAGVIPFIPLDLAKILSAAALALPIRRILEKQGSYS